MPNDLAEPDTIDWEQLARQALAGHSHAKKATRRNVAAIMRMCSEGIPLETAARLQGIQPQAIRAWEITRPAAWKLIEKARASGELLCLRKISAAADWKAQDRLLQLQQPAYAESAAPASGGGPQINVTINVPLPEAVAAGDRPMIDITPDAAPAKE